MKSYSSLLLRIVAVAALMAVPGQAQAAFLYLTGAQLYAAAATGGISVTHLDHRHSTNPSDGPASTMAVAIAPNTPVIAGNKNDIGISLQLITGGVTTFNYITENYAPPTSYMGLNLFFSTVNAPYALSSGSAPGHLTVETELGSSSPVKLVSSSSRVQDYGTAGSSTVLANKPTANGNSIFVLGLYEVEVVSFTAAYVSGSGVQGTFGLKVTATPEPATIGIGAIGLTLLGAALRRRKQVK